MASQVIVTQGISTATIFVVVFLVLKLTGHFDYDWIWVFAPYWILPALFLIIFSLSVVLYVIIGTLRRIFLG